LISSTCQLATPVGASFSLGKGIPGQHPAPIVGTFLTAKVTHISSGEEWSITSVYGPQADQDKLVFLDELRAIRSAVPEKWLVCGDFNLIYKAEDKNNGRLHRRMMGRFRRCIDDTELVELHLSGRLYTWSSERDVPTMERIDRVFVSGDWSLRLRRSAQTMLRYCCGRTVPCLTSSISGLKNFGRDVRVSC